MNSSLPMNASSGLMLGTGRRTTGAISSARKENDNDLSRTQSSSGVFLGRHRLTFSNVGHQSLDFPTSRCYSTATPDAWRAYVTRTGSKIGPTSVLLSAHHILRSSAQSAWSPSIMGKMTSENRSMPIGSLCFFPCSNRMRSFQAMSHGEHPDTMCT